MNPTPRSPKRSGTKRVDTFPQLFKMEDLKNIPKVPHYESFMVQGSVVNYLESI